MVRPSGFSFNPETAATNSFQHPNEDNVNEAAVREFDLTVEQLRNAGFIVEVIQDDPLQPLPDSIFPNNWFSTHEGSKLILYPMMSASRRTERRPAIIDLLRSKFSYTSVTDLSPYENEEKYLEGTGSIVLDREFRVAYACISPRTDRDLLLKVCEELGYLPFIFIAYDRHNQPIYHTNVMLSMGDRIAVCCFDSIHDEADRFGLKKLFRMQEFTIVELSLAQMESFAGNMLFMENPKGENFVAVSDTAWNSLSEEQKMAIAKHAQPIIAKIPTIEKHGGGSIRCMIAELY